MSALAPQPTYFNSTFPSSSGAGQNILSKQIKNPHTLNRKPHKRPAQQDQSHARPETRAPAPLLSPREEDECARGAEEEGYSYEEEDVAHGEQGAVEEEHEAEEQEEDAAAAEGYADLWVFLLLVWVVVVVGCMGEAYSASL